MKFASLAAFAAGLVALSGACAVAAPGLINTTVNLRQGPGTTTPVVTKIPGGSTVEVAGCSGEWCQVTWQGQSGYVIATSLGQGGGGAPLPGGPPPGYAGPPPGYPPPPGYYPPPGYVPPPGYYGYPYYYGGYGYGYGPYWRGGWRRW
jgi:hypothetical protein